jgi:RNA polymerase sigma-70 factor (ECF subfamily)
MREAGSFAGSRHQPRFRSTSVFTVRRLPYRVCRQRVWITASPAHSFTSMIYERELDPQTLGDHIDRLYRAARALCGSREEAEDLVQETFARVLSRPRTLKADNDVGYLLRALRNTFVSTCRAASRRPRIEHSPARLDFVEDRGAVTAEATIDAAEVYAAISQLPDDLRDALGAIDVVGLSYREAARALGVREATITTRLYRARQRVAHALVADDKPAAGDLIRVSVP